MAMDQEAVRVGCAWAGEPCALMAAEGYLLEVLFLVPERLVVMVMAVTALLVVMVMAVEAWWPG